MEDAPPRNRPGAFVPSLVAALAILAYVLVTTSVSVVLGQLAYLSELSAEFYLAEFGRTALLYTAFAAACLLSFWLVAPIVAHLSLKQVIARVLVAAGVSFVVILPIQFAIVSSMYADVEPVESGGLTDLVNLYPEPNVLLIAIGNMLQYAIGRLPLIALAGLALWWWLRRKESAHGEA